MPRNRVARILVLVIALTCACAALAQQTLGRIQGTVTDSAGALIEDTTVAVTNEQTGTCPSAPMCFPSRTTDSIPRSTPASSFRPTARPPGSTTLNVMLKPGQVSTTVQVTATPLLNTVDTANDYVLDGTEIASRAVVDLPRQSRHDRHRIPRRRQRHPLREVLVPARSDDQPVFQYAIVGLSPDLQRCQPGLFSRKHQGLQSETLMGPEIRLPAHERWIVHRSSLSTRLRGHQRFWQSLPACHNNQSFDTNGNSLPIGPSSNFANTGIVQNTFDATTNLYWILGRHTLSFGFSHILNRANQLATIGFTRSRTSSAEPR